MARSVLPVAGLVLGVVGVVVFVGLGAGAWVVRREADRQTTDLAARADAAKDAADRIVVLIRDVLARVREDLAAARDEAEPPAPAGRPNLFARTALRQAKRSMPDEVARARDVVGLASEAAVVAGAVLEAFEGGSADRTPLRLRADDLSAARGQLDQAVGRLRTTQDLLGPPPAEQSAAVEAAVAQAARATDQFEQVLAQARDKTAALKESADTWTLRAAVAATLVATLGLLGQVFLLRAAWHGLRGG